MKNKLKKLLTRFALPLAFWLAVWQITAMIIGKSFLLPDIPTTACALVDLLADADFYLALIFSLLRVIAGLMLGIIIGSLLAVICHRSPTVKYIVTPIINVIKSTPVASFIILLWVLMTGDGLSVFIGFLMVMPIIYQSIYNGLLDVDIGLSEVADVFEFSKKKRFMLLTLPTLKKYFIPALITSSGLAWKAVIAAEIIAYTTHSIGQAINDAKYDNDSPTVFAWTIVVIIFSLLLEWSVGKITRRWSDNVKN